MDNFNCSFDQYGTEFFQTDAVNSLLKKLQRDIVIIQESHFPEHKINKITSDDRILQLSIVQDQVETIVTKPSNDGFFMFIGLLLSIIAMADSDESLSQNWGYEKSRLKIYIKNFIEQLSCCYEKNQFKNIKSEAIKFFNANFHNHFNQSCSEKFLKILGHKSILSNSFFSRMQKAARGLTITIEEVEPQTSANMECNDVAQIRVNYDKKIISQPNVVVDAELLHEELKALLCCQLSFRKQYKSITHLRPRVEIICQELKSLFHKSSVPLNDDERIIELVSNLNTSMIQIYRNIINKARESIIPSGKILKNCIRFSFHAYCKILINNYCIYYEIRPEIWFEIQELYSIAESFRLENKKLESVFEWHGQLETIKDMYHYCIILPLIEPYQFTTSELELVIYATEKWTRKIEILANNLINSTLLQSHLMNLVRSIGLPVVSRGKLGFCGAEVALPKYVIDCILNSLKNIKPCLTPLSSPFFIDLRIEFSNCYHWLCHVTKMQSNSTKPKKSEPFELIIDDCQIENHTNSDILSKSFTTVSCLLLAKNDQYFKVFLQDNMISSLQPGELVCFKLNNANDESSSIGMIDSIQLELDANVIMNIRVLANSAIPVNIIKTQGSCFKETAAIIGLRKDAGSESHVIIVPSMLFSENMEIMIQLKDSLFEVVLSTLLAARARYQMYAVEAFHVSKQILQAVNNSKP